VVGLVIRLVIIADSGHVRGALRAVLARERDIEVSATTQQPDVAIIDMDMPGGRWLAAARRVAYDAPGCATIALIARPTPRALQQALQVQVRGFASKQLPPGELVEMIRQVAGGDRVIDPKSALAARSVARNPLTAREVEVLRLAADGLSSKAIGLRLFLTDGTVRNHMSAILRKTGARNRLDAIRRAQDAGWL
jgi:two-component system response regulator DesR